MYMCTLLHTFEGVYNNYVYVYVSMCFSKYLYAGCRERERERELIIMQRCVYNDVHSFHVPSALLLSVYTIALTLRN